LPKSTQRPSKTELLAATGRRLPDVMARDLKVLFCGINPGLYSAAVGHHFARPGNRFWVALSAAGFTERLLPPAEDRQLLKLGYGLTNIVARATAQASELAPSELVNGRRRLERKIRRCAPRWVAILGIGAYRIAFEQPHATFGPQPGRLARSRVWVLPNPSGLNAGHQPTALARAFRQLRRAVSGRKR
jgi:TDG/mug DNA glycosylase family protein